MSDLTKLTKAQLINLIQEKEATKSPNGEYNFDNFKEELNLDYDTETEWIDYIKKIQTINAERLNDSVELLKIKVDLRNWASNKIM
tara:strand:+ start:3492 stop:3749 length:258 start_codon:yes stop_codon:yes gene_type:complete